MKGLIVLIVLIGIGLWAVYQFGGFAELDPATQMAQMEQGVKEGMTWEQVADLREPKKLTVFDFSAEFNPEREMDFNRQQLANMIANNQLDGGFKFRYDFSQAAAYEVYFDETGKVTEHGKGRTVSDLFVLPGGSQ